MLRCAVVLALLGGCREIHALADGGPGETSDGPVVAGDGPGAIDARSGDAATDASDGAPMRLPCASSFDPGLTASTYGRLDGFLVAVVTPTDSKACRADTDHLHLQIQANGLLYDIAVNIGTDVHTTAIDRAAFSPWSEGWHFTGDGTSGNVFVDYPGLGLHSATIPLSTPTDLVNAMAADFATVNHISLYATSYDTQDGAHLVHYNGAGHDGMIVTRPLSPSAHMRAFSFNSDSF